MDCVVGLEPDPEGMTLATAGGFNPTNTIGNMILMSLAPELRAALAALVDCCAGPHDDELHPEYAGPHDEEKATDCTVCVARRLLAIAPEPEEAPSPVPVDYSAGG
jgi:hypothetical protein